MNFLSKIADKLYRRQKVIEIVAIFLFFCLVAFRIDKKKTTLFWSNYPFIAISIALLTALFAIIWIRIEKQKTQSLIRNLQSRKIADINQIKAKLEELSLRQKEIFDLIRAGRTNKEIMSELSIELSTLKTHINHIYKILGIKHRKEAQKFINTLDNSK